MVKIPGAFSKRENWKAAGYILLNLMLLLASGIFAFHWHQRWFYLVVFVLVGSRAQSLYILQHETMHSLLFSNRRANIGVGILLSALLGTRYFDGTRLHMIHHRLTGQPNDPNDHWHSTAGKKPGWTTTRFFISQLMGIRLLIPLLRVTDLLGRLIMPSKTNRTTLQAKDIDNSSSRSAAMIDLSALILVQAIVFSIIALLATPWVYFLLYLAPMVTLTAFFEAIRSFSEHVLPGEIPTTDTERERLFHMRAGRIERFFISQFSFHYHHLHHLYPNVVTFKMPELHRWLQQNDPDYTQRYIERPGYVETLLRYTLNRSIPGAGLHYPIQENSP